MNRTELLKKIVQTAGRETLKYFGQPEIKYTKRHDEDFVTQADLASEKIIISAIKKYFPNDGIISEESDKHSVKSQYVWIIDPLDGTWNFSKNIPVYAVIVAIAKNGQAFCGAVYFPKLDEFYFAQENKGAYLNEKKIMCHQKTDIDNLRFTGYFQPEGIYKKKTLKILAGLEKRNSWITEYGCGAYDLLLVASGRSHASFMPAIGGSIWDVAAPYVILGESGCKITDLDGKRCDIDGKNNVLAANPALHKKLMKLIK